MPSPPWITITAGALLTGAALGLGWSILRRKRQSDILTEWALTTRPLFNPKERLFFRLLCDALPHHVVLAKMPLIRFCRPVDLAQVRYWHEMLGSIYVTFVVCAPNGRVLAALDVDSEHRTPSRRISTIKEEALQACRIRYVKCRADQFPKVSELQMLVPQQGTSGRAAVPDTVDSVRKVHATTLAHAVRARRGGQTPGAWGDSMLGTDSFFAPDSRSDDFAATDTMGLAPGPNDQPTEPMPMPMPSPPPSEVPRVDSVHLSVKPGKPLPADDALP